MQLLFPHCAFGVSHHAMDHPGRTFSACRRLWSRATLTPHAMQMQCRVHGVGDHQWSRPTDFARCFSVQPFFFSIFFCKSSDSNTQSHGERCQFAVGAPAPCVCSLSRSLRLPSLEQRQALRRQGSSSNIIKRQQNPSQQNITRLCEALFGFQNHDSTEMNLEA